MTRKQIGKTVAECRKTKKISTYRIYEETGVKPHQLASIENATKNYTIETLEKVCHYLKLLIEII